MKKEFFNMRLTKQQKEEIRKCADRQGRSMASYLLWLHKSFKERRIN